MKFVCLSCLLLAGLFLVQAKQAPLQIKVQRREGVVTKSELFVGATNEEDTKDAPQDQDVFEINKDESLRDGDIVSSTPYNTLVDETKHWGTKSIPVTYVSALGLEAIATIEEARREYEMRTCLSFVDRTAEDNYIAFAPLNGCYSSVGEVGGPQTISIGNGCEKMSVVQHEIMHALGIYHEQSRTDRDDYVTIETANIDSGKEHNFDTYNYDVVDDRRVPYDYNSVMHYGDTSFSSNGLPTIVTIDPAFQDVIGQRRTFSDGDVTKISRMYQCTEPLRFSYSCNFEEESICGYVQDTTDAGEWIRYTIGETSEISVSPSVPETDGTKGTSGIGTYMLFDSNVVQGGVANMRTMRLKSKVTQQCLEFSYYMDLTTDSDASLSVYVATIDTTTGEILQVGSPVVTLTGDHENYWNVERLTISTAEEYKLVFAASSGGETLDAIAVDDITVLDKPCETGYFVINDYAELIASSSPGDYLYSPVMYTDDGYAFQILVYPVGSSSATSGYMSMYYSVAMGVNDDKLKWPFYDRFLKLSVVDQDADALIRMNQFSNFITSLDGGDWDQPTTERNGGYGYRNFMKVSDITNTRNFVKHNSVMFSIEVTDMTEWAASKRNGDPYVVRPSNSLMLTRSGEDQREPLFNPCPQDDDTVTESKAIAIAGISAGIVFVLMVLVLFAFNYQHQKQFGRIVEAFLKRDNAPPTYHRTSYSQPDGHVNFSVDIDKK